MVVLVRVLLSFTNGLMSDKTTLVLPTVLTYLTIPHPRFSEQLFR
jgi:hypothetical protein